MNTKSATPSQAEAQDAVLPCPFCGAPAFTGLTHGVRYARCGRMSCVAHETICAPAEWNKRASGWRPMSSAPVGDVTACVDIWSGEGERRLTDCYWDSPEPGQPACWVYEDVAADGYSLDLTTLRVPDPVAWMPAPVKPEGL